jgi:predicted  nucleic acid-binding Zn-ribbon protein
MKFVVDFIGDNPMVVYIVGMSLVVILAGIFCLSIWYYIKAKELAPRLRTIKTLEDAIDRLRKDILEKEQKLRDLQPKIVEAELKIERGRQAEEWLKKAKEEIETTQKLLAAIREEFERAKVQLEDLKRQISERQQQLVELDKKSIEAEKRVEAANKEAESIRRENAELQVAVPRLRKEVEVAEKELEEKRAALSDLEKQLADCVSQINKTKGELERLNGQLDFKREELDKLGKEIDAAKKTLDAMHRETSELEARADVARGIIAKLSAQREETGEKWKNLDTALIDTSKLRAPYEGMDENDWLSEFSRRLPRYGFIFDDRAIKAFHTSLKCARQTPLAVLSGISGTGKSLLPELYSAALGTNFLSVPVQPRWDSPQDLFGFYNYMEGRYKATELARLLWQFDVYNNPDAKRWKKDGILPLNIVLLDEMNLARVEYYFSDLLSKLETRNGTDSDNDIERRKAEIEIECNAADKIDSMRHLFVSPYTLFVGTMNEDESTQTLSDKVLDRANVLRFGLPKTLAESETSSAAPNKGAFIGSWKDDGRICAAEWNAWCRPLSEATDDREEIAFLNSTVQPVLMALDKVNRAYGYRVDQAMKLYVLNYPGDYRHAVSDQLEMKILPKLNGVELQDARFIEVRNALQTAIDATRDDRLKNAFAASCNTDATFFKWRGVMR